MKIDGSFVAGLWAIGEDDASIKQVPLYSRNRPTRIGIGMLRIRRERLENGDHPKKIRNFEGSPDDDSW